MNDRESIVQQQRKAHAAAAELKEVSASGGESKGAVSRPSSAKERQLAAFGQQRRRATIADVLGPWPD